MPQDQKRRLAAIMFADIVGYTSMMQRNEQEGLANVHRFSEVVEAHAKVFGGEVLEFRGDGCLAIFDSAVEAMHAAKAIQGELQQAPFVPLRIGIHIGDIVFAKGNIYGDGVNLASRVESLGVPGSILVTERVIHDIKSHPEFEMTSLGRFQFKNVEKSMEVFALANDGFVVPKKGEIQGKLKPANSKLLIRWLAVAIMVMLISLTGFFWISQNQKKNLTAVLDQAESIEAIPTNSIAVLPFRNGSDNQQNQYFTDGMHDDLLTHLSKIGGMKVISRTSVNAYQNTTKTPPEIGRELAVANLLEGSVRRSQSQVRINVQLVKANTGEQMWSEIYDRELTTLNIFDIQTEIATKIASVLKTAITPVQQQTLAQIPTNDLEAYEDYLRARQLMEVRNAKSLYEAINLFKKVIERDPEFALAYVHLGGTHALLPFYANADEDTHFQIAWNYLEKGMARNDLLAEAYALKGYLIFCIQKDLELAVPAFEKAISINPNYETTYLWYAFAVKRLNHDNKRALEIHKKALRLNPLSPAILWNYGALLESTGDFQQAVNTHKKGVIIEPAYPYFWETLSEIYTNHLGQLDSAAIYAFQGIQKNTAQGRYLHNYLFCLENLEMLAEMEVILDRSDLQAKQDSIIHWSYQRELTFIRKDFDKVIKQSTQLKQFGKWRNKLSVLTNLYGSLVEFAPYYYQRDFTSAVEVFEAHHPNIEEKVEENLNKRVFLEYIYCLRQIDQHQKADKLLETYGHLLSNTIGWLSICYNILSDNSEEGLRQLSLLYENKFYLPWQYVDYNPIFDRVRSTQSYQKILVKIKTKVTQQREGFQNYLANQD